MDYCLRVPRFPQRFGEDDWPPGARCEGEGPGPWGDRSCGLACLRMITSHFGLPVPSQFHLLQQAIEMRAFSPRGIVHSRLAELGERQGLTGSAVAVETADQLRDLLTTRGPLVASITHQFPEDGRRGGHLVVVTGLHDGPEPTITFRDPSRWGATHSHVPLERFFSSFTGRGIWFSARSPAATR